MLFNLLSYLVTSLIRRLIYLIEIMGNSRSTLLLEEENLRQIEEETGFTSNQIERLWSRFTSLDKQQKGYLTREDFLRIPELAINPLGDRIVHAFFRDGRSSDLNHHGDHYSPEKGAGADRDVVNFCDFVRVLAHFRPLKKNMEKNKLNSRQEKLKFAFRMYDLDGDDRISKEELLAVLTMMVGDNITEEQLNSIAERTIMEADDDKDGFISFDDFCKVLERTDVEQKMSIRFLS